MGKVFKFHNDLDTDQIIASQYLLLPTIDDMKSHAMESQDPTFAERVQPGDFVVGGSNFGCGSSREQAPSVLKALGVKAVIAKSFARIFYRNSINIGLAIVECPEAAEAIEEGHTVEADLDNGILLDQTTGKSFHTAPFPPFIQTIITNGGLIASIKKGAVK